MRRLSSWTVATLILIAAGLWVASGHWQRGQQKTEARPAAAPSTQQAETARAVRAVVSAAEMRPEIVRVLGRTEAKRKVELRAQIDGRAEALPVEKGAMVQAGETVTVLANEDRSARLQEAQALLRQREIEFEASRQLNQRGFRPEVQHAEAAAKLDAGRAIVKRMEVEVGHTVIKAPFRGVLEKRPVELGSFVKIGDAVATIVDLDPIKVVAYVAERDIARVVLGAPAQAAVPDGTTIDGTITFVAATADGPTRTFRVEMETPNPDRRLIEGLTVELRVPVGTAQAHRITPAWLSLADDGQVGVKTVAEGGTVRFMPIQILAQAEEGRIWVGGLPEKVTLISVGQEFVRDGQSVRAVIQDRVASGGAS